MLLQALLSFLSVSQTAQAESWPVPVAGSLQRPALALGNTPLQRSRGEPEVPSSILLPAELRGEAIEWAQAQAKQTSVPLEIRLWPTRSDEGQWVWVFASGVEPGLTVPEKNERSEPFFPHVTRGTDWTPREVRRVFEGHGLYDLPRFSDGIWERGAERLEWPHPALLEPFLVVERARLSEWKFTELPRPPEQNGKPVEFRMTWDGSADHWSPSVDFDSRMFQTVGREERPALPWPSDFQSRYREGVRRLTGEAEAVFPRSGRRMRFTRKNAQDRSHELELLADYLEETYRELREGEDIDLTIERFRFEDLGSRHSNLLIRLPATRHNPAKKPVVLADHYDTAYAETHFEEYFEKRSVPGADDNASATQALIEAARILGPLERDQEIWLLHLTGEEYPADCLGARHQVAHWLDQGVDVAGIIVLDMIAFVPAGASRNMFQVHAGRSGGSLELADRLVDETDATLKATVRAWNDPRSYLYNTDGIIFDDVGYPVVLVNEPMNRWDFFDRPHYHQLTDTSDTLDLPYVEELLKRVFVSVAR